MNRKGTEKPIEIFVALFIILAVALVMLKLFQNQIAEQGKKIADVQQEQKAKELRNKVDQACKDRCVEASNSGCSLASLAALCVYGSDKALSKSEFIDLNNDQNIGYDDTLLAGVGVCEDRIYCFHTLNSCCAREISANSCKGILKQYWEQKGLIDTGASAADQTSKLNQLLCANVNPGSCSSTNARWDKLAGWPTC
jgi:hypothetical protein